jgi:hypothetical protein
LLASNSILFVDNSDTVFVKARVETATQFNLYGHGDKYGRENILRVKNFNNGIHRAFSSVKVGETEVASSEGWIAEYGFRQKTLSFDFITTASKEQSIAQNILDDFQVPKPELEIEVKSVAVPGIDLFDLVSADYDYKTVPDPLDDDLPMIGSAQLGSAHLAHTEGAFRIMAKEKWKVIGIEEDTVKFITTLKLRQTGTKVSDGIF